MSHNKENMLSVNQRLQEQDTNKNGITYVKANTLKEGDVFEGFLVGKHMDRDDASKISTLIFQDEGGSLFGLNSNFMLVGAINSENGSKYDQFRVTYGGKKRSGTLKNAAHHWEVVKGDSRITKADSQYGNASGPQTVAGL